MLAVQMTAYMNYIKVGIHGTHGFRDKWIIGLKFMIKLVEKSRTVPLYGGFR